MEAAEGAWLRGRCEIMLVMVEVANTRTMLERYPEKWRWKLLDDADPLTDRTVSAVLICSRSIGNLPSYSSLGTSINRM